MKTFTLLTLGFLLGAITIAACTKSTPPAPAPTVSATDVATVQAASVASQAADADAAQHAQAKALTATKVQVLASRAVAPHAKARFCLPQAERVAYTKAWQNAITANQLLGRHAFQDVFEVPPGYAHCGDVGGRVG